MQGPAVKDRRRGGGVRRPPPLARLHLRLRGGIAWIELRGHDFDAALEAELVAMTEALDLDPDVRVVVVEFPRAAATTVAASAAEAGLSRPVAPAADGVAAVAALRVPVLGLVRGAIFDEWLELALACDLRVAARGSRFAARAVREGRLPRRGATQRLPRLIGRPSAAWMLFLGEPMTASRAQHCGLVDRVVVPGELAGAGRALARRIAARAPVAQRFAKEAILAAGDLPLAEGLRLEGDLYTLLQTTADRSEGVAAFLARRRPRFRGA